MKLLQNLKSIIPPLYTNEKLPFSEVKVIAKLYAPFLNFFWYLTESDGEDICFGFVNLANYEMAELGYFSIIELGVCR
ncbi:MAG TPA: hypothetical protein DF296_08480 [Candidatus Margulisbacteria bacterium]|nr:MAG: hypothetical protein A2X43_08150 [Candidatus Margulisbacteria bacterium GWD2_39_127]OGI06911.1 MAG: hypothetical protein A2X41_10540 [Candidatus Margulisbacteria bacterium GWE2_39_32]HAR63617.1 hypothetical protein [Candidatus Margulisiibacteriota bacterium]HCT85222.1 hypothetical protein [Candidatus Margulisiibacteriota bacterium]